PAAKKVGRPPKAASTAAAAPATGAKRGRKPKADKDAPESDVDLSDIEDDLAGDEPVAAVATTEEKVKPLRMKISKAKERALMKEFGLDET
ncbi:RNA polymerase sigma factor RpoD, partial [Xylella fastidiosa subsp. multiplex]|nr:RNA polymerase sigma factor RpoD [Xylella fastidiosa subsp. multiplex]